MALSKKQLAVKIANSTNFQYNNYVRANNLTRGDYDGEYDADATYDAVILHLERNVDINDLFEICCDAEAGRWYNEVREHNNREQQIARFA